MQQLSSPVFNQNGACAQKRRRVRVRGGIHGGGEGCGCGISNDVVCDVAYCTHNFHNVNVLYSRPMLNYTILSFTVFLRVLQMDEEIT